MTTTLTPSTKRDGRKENASATQAALQLAALQWFSTQGFEKAPVGSICADAGVTVGALYHHYGDKKGLFAAVVEQLDAQLVAAALDAGARKADDGGGPWEVFLGAVDVILAAGLNVPLRRLMLTQAPAVLGAEVWGEIRQRQGLGAMQRQIQALQGHGIFVRHQATRLAPLILGTLYGAIESLPDQAEAAPQALEEAKRCVHAVLHALRDQA
jgi:AcrR family transcriptional regulator